MRFVISGGGTGGGVYPALAAVDALKLRQPDAKVLWIASDSGPERAMVERAGLPFEGVPGGPFVGVGAQALINLPKIAWGTGQAQAIVLKYKPNATLSTGGWTTIPATLASWGRCPTVIYMPDTEPGTAIKYLARVATRIAVTTDASVEYFPNKAVVTGYPLRAELLRAAGFDALGQPLADPPDSRVEARKRFGLRDDLPTVLIMGGSKGARSINEALIAHLPELLQHTQILHIAGALGWESVQSRTAEVTKGLPDDIRARYHSEGYLHSEDMALALAAADLAVGRAGASALGEFPLFGLPAILVPYPHAWRYQKTNADVLAGRGAAIRLDDERLMDDLVPTVLRLLDDAVERERMSAAMREVAKPDAAARIADLLIELANLSAS
jgi:undecaprenyldiphospho-muramoylpentapeptide beta-N-acetylglucosaminyltransferase